MQGRDERFDGMGWTGPEDEAVSWIGEAGICLRTGEFCENGVKNPAGEVGGEDFVSLLLVSAGAVGVVADLD